MKKILFIIPLLLLICSICLAATLGITTTKSETYGLDQNDIAAYKVSMSEAGSVTKFTAYIKNGDGSYSHNIKALLYSDDSGYPDSLLASSSSTSVSAGYGAGWFDITISYSLSSGTFWLGLISDDESGSIQVYGDENGATDNSTYVSDSFSSPSSTAPTAGAYISDRDYSLYATYTTASGRTRRLF